MRLYSNDTYQISNQFVVMDVSGIPRGIFNRVVANVSRHVRLRLWGDFDIREWKAWEPNGVPDQT